MSNDEKSGGMKWWIIGIALLAAAFVGVWLFKSKGEAAPEFVTTKVVRTNVIHTVTATGTLNPVLNVQVGSQISGIIQKLFADFNSQVKSNQIIAQLDPATYRANVNSAEGELANANASLELAQINARRASELLKDKLIAQSEADQSVATLHQAEAQVKIRTATLERANVDLGRCTIYAPVDGTVIDRKVDVGQTVAASLSAPVLFQIANDLTKMQINTSISELEVGEVQVGQTVEFTVDAFQYSKFPGRVTQVRNAPITVQNVVTYDTIIEVSNDDLKLKPGMTATVSIVTSHRENTLAVPNATVRFKLPDQFVPKQISVSATNTTPEAPAIASTQSGEENRWRGGGGGEGGQRRGNRARVEGRPTRTIYTIVGDVAKATPADLKANRVKLGISDSFYTEVVEGLNEGDVVVTGVITAMTNALVNNPFGGGGGFPRR